jgi:hypothetical protein
MDRLLKATVILFLGIVLSGCSVGLPYHKAKPNLPALAAGKSRVFVYRSFNVPELVHPRVVLIDGKIFGDILTGTTSYRDVASGHHIFSLAKRNRKLNVQLRPGEVTFLRITIHSDDKGGIDTIIKVVPRQTAEQDLQTINVIEAKFRNLVK